jgi:hypothetical protein
MSIFKRGPERVSNNSIMKNDRLSAEVLNNDIEKLIEQITRNPNVRYILPKLNVNVLDIPDWEIEPVEPKQTAMGNLFWAIVTKIPKESIQEKAIERRDDFILDIETYKSDLEDYKKFLRRLKQVKNNLESVEKTLEKLIGFEKGMSREPVLLSVNQVSARFIVPAVITFDLGDLGDVQGDVWALKNASKYEKHSLQNKIVPQIVVSFADHRAEIGSARISVTYTGPTLSNSLVSGTEVYSGQLIQNSEITLDNGKTVPFYAATTGQIVSGIVQQIEDGSDGLIKISSDQFSAIFAQLVEQKTHVALEVQAIYDNSLLNEKFAAAFSQHLGHTLLRLYVTKLFEDTMPQMEALLLALEQGKLNSFYDFRIALFALATGETELISNVLSGDTDASEMLKLMLERGVVNNLGQLQTTNPSQDTSIAVVNQEGAQLMKTFGLSVDTYESISARQLSVIFDIHILMGLFDNAAGLIKKLEDYGKGISEVFEGYIDVGIKRNEYELDVIKAVIGKLEDNREKIVGDLSSEVYAATIVQLKNKLKNMAATKPEKVSQKKE